MSVNGKTVRLVGRALSVLCSVTALAEVGFKTAVMIDPLREFQFIAIRMGVTLYCLGIANQRLRKMING